MRASFTRIDLSGGMSRRDGDRAWASPTATLRRILAFSGWTIDDLIDNPMARRDVLRWFKITRWMNRQIEIGELERQWNPTR